MVAGDLVRTPHGWCFFWPIGAASAFCIAIFLQSAQPWRRFGSTTLNEACVFSGRASESATCTFVATKVVSGMMVFFSDPSCNRRWCFFWPIGAASAFCIAIFLQSAQPWRRFGSTTLNEACVFSGRASESAACTKVVAGIMVFFLTHRATVCRRRKMMPWALLQPSFFAWEER